jgi:hypothetical protein
LKQALERVRDTKTDDEERAVSLCWVLHLVGDIHQPLHATALISTKETFAPYAPPHGDEGGNLLAIKITQDDKNATNLHTYWDSLLFEDEPQFNRVEAVVAKLMIDMPAAGFKAELDQGDFLAWADESYQLAKTVAYSADGQGGFLKCRPLPAHPSAELRGMDADGQPAS